MEILSIVNNILGQQKKLDLKSLPSQGFFYKDDFEIFIKKATMEDIIEYELNYDNTNIALILNRLKKIVYNNTVVKNGTGNDIKNVDIIFIFFEIVKFTNKKQILIEYSTKIGEKTKIEFCAENFNYLNLARQMSHYDSGTKEFNISGYRYSLPSGGVENSLTDFLIDKSNQKNHKKLSEYNYDFIYFLGHKSTLTFSEIENLIEIFNYDLDQGELDLISNIVNIFSGFQHYSLKKDDNLIDITGKINLRDIWK